MVPRRRPLVYLALAWILGLLAYYELELHSQSAYLPALAVFTLLMAIGLFLMKNRFWPALLLLAVSATAVLFAEVNRLPIEDLYSNVSRIERVRGEISSYPTEHPDRTSFELTPEHLPGKIQIHYHHPARDGIQLDLGDRVEIAQNLQIPENFADFDYQSYLLSRDIWAVAHVWSAQEIKVIRRNNSSSLIKWGYKQRQKIFTTIDRVIDQPQAGLLKGLLFGDRSELGDELETQFRDAGVMHVLAVSGLHLGILIGLFWAILRFCRFPFTAIYISLMPLIFLYLTIVGFKTSLVRASMMFAFVALGWVIAERGLILKRWIDPMQGLAAAALLIMIITPMAVYDVSFQLSFAATAGILLALQYALPILTDWQHRCERSRVLQHPNLIKRVTRFAKGVTIFFVVSLAAQLSVAPLIGLQFDRLYVTTLLANFAIVPLATMAIWFSIPTLIASGLVPPIAPLAASIENSLLAALTSTAEIFAKLPGNYFEIGHAVQLAALAVLPLLLSAPTFWQLEVMFQRGISHHSTSNALEG